MTKASTGMLEKGTPTPSPSPDLIPATNRVRDGSIKSEIVSMEGFNEDQRQLCQSQIVSTEGFTPGSCAQRVAIAFRCPKSSSAL
jgi:hypothetical protein